MRGPRWLLRRAPTGQVGSLNLQYEDTYKSSSTRSFPPLPRSDRPLSRGLPLVLVGRLRVKLAKRCGTWSLGLACDSEQFESGKLILFSEELIYFDSNNVSGAHSQRGLWGHTFLSELGPVSEVSLCRDLCLRED